MSGLFLLEIVIHMIILSWIHKTLTLVPIVPPYDDEIYDDDDYDNATEEESEDYCSQEVEERATDIDVTYLFYSKIHHGGMSLKDSGAELLNDTDFSIERHTLFIIHGWKGHRDSNFNYYLKEALLDKHDINLFVVDWGPLARRNYVTAQRAVLNVGILTAEFIKILMSMYGLKLSTVAFVGHSLGAHISGNVGAALNGEVEYIVGLDPASLFFRRSNLNNRLDSSDAKFVQAIHTSRLGIWHSAGHSDYYPNGGRKQPGCGYDLLVCCAHRRAWSYYVESVSASSNHFVARRCDSYDSYVAGECDKGQTSLMAGYPIDTNASGTYYLTTNKSPPYGRG